MEFSHMNIMEQCITTVTSALFLKTLFWKGYFTKKKKEKAVCPLVFGPF